MLKFMTDAAEGFDWKSATNAMVISSGAPDEPGFEMVPLEGQRLMGDDEVRALIDARPQYGTPVVMRDGTELTRYPQAMLNEKERKDIAEKVKAAGKPKERARA